MSEQANEISPVRSASRARPIGRRYAYECVANALRAEVLTNADNLRPIEPDIDAKFCQPFRQFDRGYVVTTLATDAGFVLDPAGRIIRLSSQGLDLMMREVARRKIDRFARRDVQRVLTELYVLHEARHISQGFWDFEGVQKT
jgi:hypothetical protein